MLCLRFVQMNYHNKTSQLKFTFNLKTNNFTQTRKATYMYAAEINIQYSILVKFQFGINFDFCKKKLGKLFMCAFGKL